MNANVLKAACEALGWKYSIQNNILLVTEVGIGSNFYGEFALKLNMSTNEVTYNTYYMPNAQEKVEELKVKFQELNAEYSKNALISEFEKAGFTYRSNFTFIPTFAQHRVYTIKQVIGGHYLDNQGSVVKHGNPIVKWRYTGGPNQLWEVINVGGGRCIIRSTQNSKYVVGLLDNNVTINKPVCLVRYTGALCQQWYLRQEGSMVRQYVIYNAANPRFYLIRTNEDEGNHLAVCDFEDLKYDAIWDVDPYNGFQ